MDWATFGYGLAVGVFMGLGLASLGRAGKVAGLLLPMMLRLRPGEGYTFTFDLGRYTVEGDDGGGGDGEGCPVPGVPAQNWEGN